MFMLLHEMEIFFAVVTNSSFSKAAEQLAVSKSYVSKHITKLEQDLRVKLIVRSTRKLSLTQAGQQFHHHCEHMVRAASEGYAMIDELQGTPAGILKVSLPPAVGICLLAKVLPGFMRNNPQVKLNIDLNNQLVDIIQGGYDLVVRAAKLESSNLIVQQVYNVKSVICASPHYFKQHGKPALPEDLTQHNVATYNLGRGAEHIHMQNKAKKYSINVQGNFKTNNLDLIKEMVLGGIAMAALPEYVVIAELKAGRLMICLDEYILKEQPLYAIYPQREFKLPKLQRFLDLLLSL